MNRDSGSRSRALPSAYLSLIDILKQNKTSREEKYKSGALFGHAPSPNKSRYAVMLTAT